MAPFGNETLNEDIDIDIGYYIHKEKLGEGGFSKVMLATHLLTGEKVAVKCMDKKKLGQDLFRIKTEIKALRILRHKNIAKLLQVIENESKIYLVLEISSKSLFHLKTCCGSPAYAAPELIAGNVYSGPAADVWSAGVILYALLVGQLPFDDENLSNLYKKIQAGNYKIPFWLSEESKSVIRSMLNINPAKRITVKDLLRHPWINAGIDPSNIRVEIHAGQMDEGLLWEVHKYFPMTPLAKLRKNIAAGFGYQTASYWLLKSKLERGLPIGRNLAKKQSNSVDSILDKIQEETEVDAQQTSKSEEFLASASIKPQLLAVKPKQNLDQDLDRVNLEKPENRKHKLLDKLGHVNTSTPPKRKPEPFLLSPRKTCGANSPASKIPVPIKSPLRDANETSNKPTVENSPKIAKTIDYFEKLTNSPLRDVNVTNDSCKTPVKQSILPTPKKSLLKRILATATPSAGVNPRNITASAHTTTKNITMTAYGDANQCVAKIMEGLTAKGIECKQKGFLLRCALNNKYENVLTFNLEVCKFGDKCAIQRKRLRGDAWHYKKICEEILRISNEMTTD
ncbi:maternal embryonic leucine zipper kinase-like protein 1, partial [Dinothrombium tinctorium]|uniref:non-specific serine/threonine protein kinase n=1 Tax=Dinothrombium tinctorium TaxID=1965070 RepID=A0A3S3RTK8_9ACAR